VINFVLLFAGLVFQLLDFGHEEWNRFNRCSENCHEPVNGGFRIFRIVCWGTERWKSGAVDERLCFGELFEGLGEWIHATRLGGRHLDRGAQAVAVRYLVSFRKSLLSYRQGARSTKQG
jgi:hypothetical protein